LGAVTLVGCQTPPPPPPLTLTSTPSLTPTSAPAVEEFALAQYPGKVPLRLLTDRPPQLETPLEYFRQDLTPNDAFYVRWHLSGVPTSVDVAKYRPEVKGHVKKALSLSLDQLRKEFQPVTVVAVNQCSGNQRSLFEPHVPRGQWINGALGCAKWTGVRLKDVLAKAGVGPKAVDVTFQGIDQAPFASVPAFAKSLAIAHANQEEVLLAYEMNGSPLPMLNGFPLRVVVPGWYATYWVKALSQVNRLLPDPMDAVSVELDVAAKQRDSIHDALSDNHAVERISVMHRHRGHVANVLGLQGVNLQAGTANLLDKLCQGPFQSQSASADLDGDLPKRRQAEKKLLALYIQNVSHVRAQLGVVAQKP